MSSEEGATVSKAASPDGQLSKSTGCLAYGFAIAGMSTWLFSAIVYIGTAVGNHVSFAQGFLATPLYIALFVAFFGWVIHLLDENRQGIILATSVFLLILSCASIIYFFLVVLSSPIA